MTLDYAILGFLNYRPHTGYDLKRHFDHTINHFWTAEQSQIYRTLISMNQAGWVEMEVIDQSDRPDRKVYHITDEGRTVFQKWLQDPIPNQKARVASLVQVFFAGQLSDVELLTKFEEAAAATRNQLELFKLLPRTEFTHLDNITSPREAFFWVSTHRLGLRSMQSYLEWLEEFIEKLKKKEIPAR
ncbi:MAG: PadR family transcriptional regulator [Anaerolineaceae bacterium]